MTVALSKPTLTAEQPIGVFDSGVGGLTVAKAVMARLPHERLIYLGDTARFVIRAMPPAFCCATRSSWS
jgi:hypothetical protein